MYHLGKAGFLCGLLALTPLVASAAMQWSEYAGTQHGATGGHAGHNPRAAKRITLQDGAGAAAEIVLPTLERRPLVVAEGKVEIRPTGVDNFHLLYARRENTASHETALRYQYLNGKPSGRSPAELVNADKAPLEITPLPLTREHARYLAETRPLFMVKFQGKPLADHPISLETSNGTRQFTKTDAQGRVTIPLPNDFSHIQEGRANNNPADFALFTRYLAGGREYRTSLSAAYFVNPRHWQSFNAGLAASLAGFVVGLGVLQVARRRSAVMTKKA